MIDLQQTFLSDVDGCVADMVGGFADFVEDIYKIVINPGLVIYHDRMGESPGLLDAEMRLRHFFPDDADGGGVAGAFKVFMKDPNVYGRYIKPVVGSVHGVAGIRARSFNFVFVTALMKTARDHFRSKMEWIERWFPGTDIMTARGAIKPLVRGCYAVEDRYDTALAWTTAGVPTFLFRQPWNEIPRGIIRQTYDWTQIVDTLDGRP